jgi:hypothetical protein
MKMHSLLLLTALCIAWPTALWAAGDEHECTVATLHGSFAFTFTGTAHTADGPSQRAGIGRFVFDGAGNLVGTNTTNADGAVLRRTSVGTYTVDADCTGSIAVIFTDGPGGQATFDVVIDDDGKEYRTVTTPPPNAVNPVPTRNSVGAFDEPSTARYQGLADTWRESPKARVGMPRTNWCTSDR